MNVGHLRFVSGLVLGAGLLYGVAHHFGSKPQVVALMSGYTLFSLNYLLLAWIYKRVLEISQAQGRAIVSGTWVATVSLLKFAALVGSLYVLLVRYSLSGFFLAFGSLVSLLILTGMLLTVHIRSLSVPHGS